MTIRLVLLLTVVALGAPGAVFSYTSDFNSGTNEGWTGLYSTRPGTGLDPCGCMGTISNPIPALGGIDNSPYLQVEDKSDGFLYALAPSSWSGDLYGGVLSFQLRNTNPRNYVQLGVSLSQPVVRVVGANGTILYYFNMPGADLGWTPNHLVLAQSTNWRLGFSLSSALPTSPEVAATLVDVASIGILMDWVSGYGSRPIQPDGVDITGLDDVSLIAVPEPGTVVLLGGGLVALLALRKRK